MEQMLTQYFLLFTYYEFGRSKTYSTSCLVKIADGELINYIIKQYNWNYDVVIIAEDAQKETVKFKMVISDHLLTFRILISTLLCGFRL